MLRFENKAILNEWEERQFNKHVWESTQNWCRVPSFVLIKRFKGVCVQSESIFPASSMQRDLRFP
jgi:hypothetical protein